jgi:hypothetical protein
VNVGGSTLHSFAGILDFTKPKVKLAAGLWCWSKFKKSFQKTDALLVDEVSMVDCELLEKVSRTVALHLKGHWACKSRCMLWSVNCVGVSDLLPEFLFMHSYISWPKY